MRKKFLDELLGSKSSLRILRVLTRDRTGMTGRELARRSAVSAASAHAAAKKLAAMGLVTLESVGTGTVYSLNERHYLLVSAGIGMLFGEEEDYIGTVAFESAKPIKSKQLESLVVFGSAARGNTDTYGDIDVLFLLTDSYHVPAVKNTLLQSSDKTMSRFGVRVSPYVISVGEFVDRYRKGDALIRNIVKDGKRISGKPLSEVLTDERP